MIRSSTQVMRKDDSKAVIVAIEINIEEIRGRRRPKKRWINTIDNCMKINGK